MAAFSSPSAPVVAQPLVLAVVLTIALVPATAQRIPRCYTASIGVWSGTLPSDNPADYRVPPRIRLDTALVVPRRGLRALWPSRPRLPGQLFHPAVWRANGDSLDLVWANGITGVHVLASVVTADSLNGVALPLHMSVAPGSKQPNAVFVARAVPCVGVERVDADTNPLPNTT